MGLRTTLRNSTCQISMIFHYLPWSSMISPSLSGNATDHLGRGFHYVSNRAPRAAESSIARPAASGGGGGGGGATTDSLKISALSAADGVGSGTITCIPVLQIRHTSMTRTSY